MSAGEADPPEPAEGRRRGRSAAKGATAARVSADPAPNVLPKNFLRPCLLLLLREQPAHGYDLFERMRPLGFGPDDPGRLYRALRALEADGLARSTWESSACGPDRRIYELTRAGTEALHDAAQALVSTHMILNVFLSRYGEFVGDEQEAASQRG
ncbi:MAG: helix-turn-helix transcriptional regulator [Actinomycetota bacterium]|nr:helix-turn-helix transcriptional regulator [Actinomycetota bacterium]